MNRYRNTTDFLDEPVLERDDHGDVILAADFEVYQHNLHETLRDFELRMGPEVTPMIRAIQGVYEHHAPCVKCCKFTELDEAGVCDNHSTDT